MHTVWTTAELLCMKAVDLICQGNRSNQGVYTRRKWSVFNFYRVFFVTLGHALCETMRNRLCMVCVCVSLKPFEKACEHCLHSFTETRPKVSTALRLCSVLSWLYLKLTFTASWWDLPSLQRAFGEQRFIRLQKN